MGSINPISYSWNHFLGNLLFQERSCTFHSRSKNCLSTHYIFQLFFMLHPNLLGIKIYLLKSGVHSLEPFPIVRGCHGTLLFT